MYKYLIFIFVDSNSTKFTKNCFAIIILSKTDLDSEFKKLYLLRYVIIKTVML